jgi:hypothetical protein
LGIPPFESDPDVIDAAADQRMAHLRKYQTGANSALSQQLLNEVASARIALLSPEKKAVYDAQLRAKTAAGSTAAGAKRAVNGSGGSSSISRGKGEPSSIGGKRPPKLAVAVSLDPPDPAPAGLVSVPAADIPAAAPPIAESKADAPADTAFTPAPMAVTLQSKPKDITNLIVGVCVAVGVLLLGFVWWLIQGQGAGAPSAPAVADSTPRPDVHRPAVPPSPSPLPKPEEPKVPVPLVPSEGAVLSDKGRPENKGKGWDFRWSRVAQAVKYHLRVTGPGDNDPVIDNAELSDPSYRCNGIVLPPGADRHGWRWKVRAMVASQTWTDWSPERTFDIQPEPPKTERPKVAEEEKPSTPEATPKPDKPPQETTPPASAEPDTSVADTRTAVPDEAALAKASKEVLDIYGAEHDAAKSPAQKVALAKKFLEQAAATRNDPAARYVLFKLGRDLASQAGDATVAFQAIDEMSAAFEVDGTGMKVVVVNKAAKATLSPSEIPALVDQILTLTIELVDQDRFDDAQALAPVALDLARRSHDAALIKQVNQRKKDVQAARKPFVEVKPFADQLTAQPDDAEANYRVGRYTVTVKSNWKKGLPMLAKGSDASWKKLAQRELASPSAPDEQLALADGWWEAAQAAQAAEQSGLQLHAGEWYRKALPGVPPGLNKARVDKRLADIDKQKQPAGPRSTKLRKDDFKPNKWVDILKRVDVARDQVAGQWKRAADGIAGTGGMAYTRLILPVTIDGSYDLQVGYALRNVLDQGIVIIPIGSQGCAIYFGRTSVGIYAKQEGPFSGGFRMVTSRFFVPNALPQHVLGIAVRLDGDMVNIAITFDNVLELTWVGSKDSLDIPTIFALPLPGHPGLGTMHTDTPLFHGAALRVVSGKGSWAEPTAADKLPPDPRKPQVGGPKVVVPDADVPAPLPLFPDSDTR